MFASQSARLIAYHAIRGSAQAALRSLARFSVIIEWFAPFPFLIMLLTFDIPLLSTPTLVKREGKTQFYLSSFTEVVWAWCQEEVTQQVFSGE